MTGLIPRRFLVAVILAAALLTPGPPAGTAPQGAFTPFYSISLGGEPCISLVELAETYRVEIAYDPVTLTMTLTKGTQRLSATDLSRSVRLNGGLIPMSQPARLVRGAIYVPASTFLPVFSRFIHSELTWDDTRNGIVSPGSAYSIRRVGIEERAQGTVIRVFLADSLGYAAELGDRNWLTLTLPDASLSPDAGISTPPRGMVLDSRFVQRERDVQLTFRIAEDMGGYDVSRAPGSGDILVSIRKRREAPVQPQPETPAEAIEKVVGAPGEKHVEPFFNEDLWRIDTVVIDAGHGGRDSGAVGPKGAREKDVVLAVAKELKRLFDERGEVEGIMTRKDDTFISLHQRATIAKRSNGKLFVSIHANASRSREAKGVEVFFLSAAKTADAKSVAERENAAVDFEENPSASRKMLNEKSLLSEIERDMASNVYLKESQDLCTVLLENTVPVTRQTNRGVKQAGFYVLAGTLPVMPSILYEIGFISNPEEERMLGRVSYQKRLAQSIYDAIITFKTRHERGLFTRSQ